MEELSGRKSFMPMQLTRSQLDEILEENPSRRFGVFPEKENLISVADFIEMVKDEFKTDDEVQDAFFRVKLKYGAADRWLPPEESDSRVIYDVLFEHRQALWQRIFYALAGGTS